MPIPLINEGINLVTGFFNRKHERAQARHETEIETIKAGSEERANGWKDELALVVLILPFVAAFVPGAGPYIEQGFNTLKNSTPEWYQQLFFWGVAGALGIQQIIKPFKRK